MSLGQNPEGASTYGNGVGRRDQSDVLRGGGGRSGGMAPQEAKASAFLKREIGPAHHLLQRE